MARRKKVAVGAINVRMHPHSHSLYRGLIQDAFSLRRSIRVRGDSFMILSSVSDSEYAEQGQIQGQIARFTSIDVDLPWFDFETLSEADERQMRQINIPATLRPNLVSVSFMFDIKTHTFIFEEYFDGKTMSPRQVERFLSILFQDNKIVSKYGHVETSIVADHESLDDVFGFHTLKAITITILRPNPDDFGHLDEQIEDRLIRQNARSLELSYDAVPGQSLEPEELTKNLAPVATRNGEVIASGRNEDGTMETRSTKDHPMIESQRFDPDVLSEAQAFRAAATRLVQRLSSLIS